MGWEELDAAVLATGAYLWWAAVRDSLTIEQRSELTWMLWEAGVSRQAIALATQRGVAAVRKEIRERHEATKSATRPTVVALK